MNKTKLLILLSLLITLNSCVYFNTFYNAQSYFDEAERKRTVETNKNISDNVLSEYKKVIDKTDIVIIEHPKSKFYDNALLLKGKSHYHRQEYDLANKAFTTLRSLNPDKYNVTTDFWLALIKWRTGRPDEAIDYLNGIVNIVDDKKLKIEIYRSQADIYLELGQDSLAMNALEKNCSFDKK